MKVIKNVLLEILEYIDIINHDSATFAREYTVRASYCLHQGMPFHGLIQI